MADGDSADGVPREPPHALIAAQAIQIIHRIAVPPRAGSDQSATLYWQTVRLVPRQRIRTEGGGPAGCPIVIRWFRTSRCRFRHTPGGPLALRNAGTRRDASGPGSWHSTSRAGLDSACRYEEITIRKLPSPGTYIGYTADRASARAGNNPTLGLRGRCLQESEGFRAPAR
jgi:hypothetical protein